MSAMPMPMDLSVQMAQLQLAQMQQAVAFSPESQAQMLLLQQMQTQMQQQQMQLAVAEQLLGQVQLQQQFMPIPHIPTVADIAAALCSPAASATSAPSEIPESTPTVKASVASPYDDDRDALTLSSLDGSGSSNGDGSDTRSVPTPKAGKMRSLVLRVSARTPLEGLAGALAKRARELAPIQMDAMGPGPVTQVLRAMVLAMSFVKTDSIVLSAQCRFVKTSGTESRPSLSFDVERDMSGKCKHPLSNKTIVVHDGNVVGKVAGAMTKIVRSPCGMLRRTRLHCGPSPVALNIAAKAVALARTMLGEVAVDIKMQPILPQDARPKPSEDELVFELVPYALAFPKQGGNGKKQQA
eukprot:TRINITY_DN10746_c0_g1_i1.p1 TRINITY_DN10746_c0_g1~~TRINITY_DN10746_c0_g1_i1.p1  ORF type:complete len:376 (+),score=155.69 TRINITY_DN10746_c0_g1_i1:67-1128(+)